MKELMLCACASLFRSVCVVVGKSRALCVYEFAFGWPFGEEGQKGLGMLPASRRLPPPPTTELFSANSKTKPACKGEKGLRVPIDPALFCVCLLPSYRGSR